MIGGITRIPHVKEAILEFFEKPVATNINGNDGPTYGAAYIAANYSAGIKVKKAWWNDGPNYNVELNIKIGNETKVEEEIFPYKTRLGTKKEYSF